MKEIDCSIIFPLLNESENIEFSYNKINEIMKQTNLTYEILYINDGSTDNSEELIKNLCEKDKNVRLISFSRNFGQQPASMCGFMNCKGKCAINMDIDLEEDPNVIIDMLKAWQEGYEVITVKRKKRKDNIIKRFFSWGYYKVMKMLGCKDISNLADFRLLDRKAIDALTNSTDKNIFLRHQVNWVGFKKTTVEAVRSKRQNGTTKYNFKKSARLAVQGLATSTDKPLYFSFSFAVFFLLLSILSLVTLTTLCCF
jgi:dolichol-phosphate mannosyltransferase